MMTGRSRGISTGTGLDIDGETTKYSRTRCRRVDTDTDATIVDINFCVEQRHNRSHNRRCRFSFHYYVLLLHMYMSCLLLRNIGVVFVPVPVSSSLLAQAFVTPTERNIIRNKSRNRGPKSQQCQQQLLLLLLNQQQQQQCQLLLLNQQQQQHHQQYPTSSSTALYFFSILSNSNNNNSNENNNDADLPLARYVDVSANYTLAHTPEDYIDLRENQRLVCIGDVHGDLAALQEFLETAGVYDRATDSWCGGDTIAVQCGDILDRGMEELACYRLLSKLSQEAPSQHGKVILLVGNHEALNAMGLFQYAFSDHEHEQTIGKAVDSVLGAQNMWRKQYANNQPARWASYEPGGLLAHSLLRNMKVAVRVGKTVCVHAGLKPEHLKDHGGIEGMNASFRDWISLGDDVGLHHEDNPPKQPPIHNPVVYNHHGNYPADTPRQPWIDAEKRQRFYVNTIPPFLQAKPDDPGPIWMRDFSSPHDVPPQDDAKGTLERSLGTTLTLLDADRMVVGHTIQHRINGVLDGRAWRIDVGASKGCLGGTTEVLEVLCIRNESNGLLAEEVSIRVPFNAADGAPTDGAPTAPTCYRIPASERLVDVYTQAAVQML